jgi:hypothetical protein
VQTEAWEVCVELNLRLEWQMEMETAQLVIGEPRCMHVAFAGAQKRSERVKRLDLAPLLLHQECCRRANQAKVYLRALQGVRYLIP